MEKEKKVFSQWENSQLFMRLQKLYFDTMKAGHSKVKSCIIKILLAVSVMPTRGQLNAMNSRAPDEAWPG